MQTSATPTSTSPVSARAAQRGFTLLELLVVVAIIGILVGAVVLSIAVVGVDREVRHEVLRLQSLVELLHEESLMQTRDYGLMFTETGYRFYMYDYMRLEWIDVSGDPVLKQHAFPPQLSLELVLDGRPVRLVPNFDSQDVENPEPQVMVLSSGELTPFELSIYRDRQGGHFVLNAELDGTLEVSQEGFDAR